MNHNENQFTFEMQNSLDSAMVNQIYSQTPASRSFMVDNSDSDDAAHCKEEAPEDDGRDQCLQPAEQRHPIKRIPSKSNSLLCPEMKEEIEKIIAETRESNADSLCRILLRMRSEKKFKTNNPSKFDLAVAHSTNVDLCLRYALHLSEKTAPAYFFLICFSKCSNDLRLNALAYYQLFNREKKENLVKGLYEAVIIKDDLLLSCDFYSSLPPIPKKAFIKQWVVHGIKRQTFFPTLQKIIDLTPLSKRNFKVLDALCAIYCRILDENAIQGIAKQMVKHFKSHEGWPKQMWTAPLTPPPGTSNKELLDQDFLIACHTNFYEAFQNCFKYLCSETIPLSVRKILIFRKTAINQKYPGCGMQDACHFLLFRLLGEELNKNMHLLEKENERAIIHYFLQILCCFEKFLSPSYVDHVPTEKNAAWQAQHLWTLDIAWNKTKLSTIQKEFMAFLQKF